jgi:hypothetical protein
MRAQWLTTGTAAASPVDVVRHLVGLQAQIPPAVALSIRARTSGAGIGDVDRERDNGSIVRTWLMRRTLHLVAADDLDWLLAVLAPTLLARAGRRYDQLGMDDGTLSRSVDVLVDMLGDGPLTRVQLFDRLAAAGIDPSGQRGIHIVQHAALRGAVCFGPDRGNEPTWVSRPAASAAGVDRAEALAELARRYRIGYGPSDAHDLAAWSGLSVTDARQAWHLAGESHGDLDRDGERVVRLLPHFDPYLLGYAHRDLVVPAEHAKKVWTGGGFILPTVVVDGRAVGTWRLDRKNDTITVTWFGASRLDETVTAGIDAEVADIGRFLGGNVIRRREGSRRPRRAGGPKRRSARRRPTSP